MGIQSCSEFSVLFSVFSVVHNYSVLLSLVLIPRSCFESCSVLVSDSPVLFRFSLELCSDSPVFFGLVLSLQSCSVFSLVLSLQSCPDSSVLFRFLSFVQILESFQVLFGVFSLVRSLQSSLDSWVLF